jgi:uncharacterized membrane protein YwzB
MSLVGIVVTLLIIGLLLWALEQLPIDATIKKIIWVLVIVFAVLYALQGLGLVGSVFDARLR